MGDKLELLDKKGVVRLLREEIKREGSQDAWAKKAGVDRTYVNRVLSGRRPFGRALADALGLEIAYVRRK
jgi:hypothetical protein